jgi:hypothetical protein
MKEFGLRILLVSRNQPLSVGSLLREKNFIVQMKSCALVDTLVKK